MRGAGPVTADDLAHKTGIRGRYALEWLNAQAASGYVDYDEVSQRYALSEEQAMVFTTNPSGRRETAPAKQA